MRRVVASASAAMSYDPHTERLVSPEEIMEMVREETFYRPARRAAAFSALVLVVSAFGWIADQASAATFLI